MYVICFSLRCFVRFVGFYLLVLTQECWNPAVEELIESAAGKFRAVVAFDFRGHGRSPPLELTEETFIDDDATTIENDSNPIRRRLKCAKWEKFAVEDTLAMVEVRGRQVLRDELFILSAS